MHAHSTLAEHAQVPTHDRPPTFLSMAQMPIVIFFWFLYPSLLGSKRPKSLRMAACVCGTPVHGCGSCSHVTVPCRWTVCLHAARTVGTESCAHAGVVRLHCTCSLLQQRHHGWSHAVTMLAEHASAAHPQFIYNILFCDC